MRPGSLCDPLTMGQKTLRRAAAQHVLTTEERILKPGERKTFRWRPDSAIDSFDCVVVTSPSALPSRAFAVAVTVLDVDNTPIEPAGTPWYYSKTFGTHFQYTPAAEEGHAARLEPWTSSTILESVRFDVVGWPNGGPEIADPIAVGVCPVSTDPRATRSWTLLTPMDGNYA